MSTQDTSHNATNPDPTPRTAATARELMHDFEEATGAECCCGNLDAPARRRADRNNHPAFGDRFGHDWDFNYQCLRCLRYEHDPRINEPCPGIALDSAEAPGRVAALEAALGDIIAIAEGMRPAPSSAPIRDMALIARAALAAPTSPAGVSGEVCEGCGHEWKASSHEAPRIACCPDCTHTRPAPTPSEPVARCVGEHDWETRHPGDLAVCRRCWTVESDATPATRDE